MTKHINVVTTTKGSAFFVDLDSVIQEEIKKEKKISIERQSSGTALFIPLFDDKPKTKKKLQLSVKNLTYSIELSQKKISRK